MSSSSAPTNSALAAVDAARRRLAATLETSNLPTNLKNRLIHDVDGQGHYSRMNNIAALKLRPSNSTYCGTQTAGCCCKNHTLIQDGNAGMLQADGEFFFLGCGYHTYTSFGSAIRNEQINLSVVDKAIVNGPTGFVTISEGRIGVLQLHGDFKLLAPGTYQWFSPSVRFIGSVTTTTNIAQLGPYTLVTVNDGEVAVTFDNGEMRTLGMRGAKQQQLQHGDLQQQQQVEYSGDMSRTFFLDNPKWMLKGFLPLCVQTDRLEGNDLLSKDNVEIVMVAMSQWRVVDPQRAVLLCAETMEEIRSKVNQLVRAAIARIVAGTCIGSGPVSGGVAVPMHVGEVIVTDDNDLDHIVAGSNNKKKKTNAAIAKPKSTGGDADLAHLMQSEQATRHMGELTRNMIEMGVEVIGVYVPEKRMKNNDIRQEVAKQAVIGIKAEAERSSADATAYATITSARAQAQAIEELANAHARAGQLLGSPDETAARLALTEKTAQVLSGAKVTIFSGSPGQMPFMLNAEPPRMK